MAFCRKATELISTQMDRPLTRGERIALYVHLGICRQCRRYRRQVRAIDRVVRDSLGLPPVPEADTAPGLGEEARQRMLRAIEEQGD